MKNIKMDKNYNLIIDENDYIDDLDEKIEKILQAKEKGLLTAVESKMLLNFVISQEMKEDVKHLTEYLIAPRKRRRLMAFFNDTCVEKTYA